MGGGQIAFLGLVFLVVAGLAGVLLILRPGAEAFSPHALLALIGIKPWPGCGCAGRKKWLNEFGRRLGL